METNMGRKKDAEKRFLMLPRKLRDGLDVYQKKGKSAKNSGDRTMYETARSEISAYLSGVSDSSYILLGVPENSIKEIANFLCPPWEQEEGTEEEKQGSDIFHYGGYDFRPYRAFTYKEVNEPDNVRKHCIPPKEFFSEKFLLEYSKEEFYRLTSSDSDIFERVEDGLLAVFGREVFVWNG